MVRLLVKKVHYFANGFSERYADSHLVTVTDNLRRYVDVLGAVLLIKESSLLLCSLLQFCHPSALPLKPLLLSSSCVEALEL